MPKYEFYKNPKTKYKIKSIRDLSVSIQTGLPIRKDCRIEKGKYPYYGANGIIGYMNEYTHDGIFLVVGQDGYIGNHYIVNGRFWASNHNWVLKLKNKVNINYLKEFLDIWNYDYLISGGVIPKVTKEALKSIKVIFPSNFIQQQVVDIMDNAYKIKKSKEAEAKKLLNLIDDYILSELGITLPKEEKKKTFVVNSKNVIGGRFNPFYYS